MSEIPKSISNICLLLFIFIMTGCVGTIDRVRADFALSRADGMYERGNLSGAYDQYRNAAEAGSPRAQYILGRMYAEGDGIARNSAEAIRWIREAAGSDYPAADFEMGLRYLTGDGLPQDHLQAVEHFKKAAGNEHEISMYHLGFAYTLGLGVAPDSQEALRWFRMASAYGINVDQNFLTQSGIQAYMLRHPSGSSANVNLDSSTRLLDTSNPGDASVIQSRLKELGFYNMAVDGIWGQGSLNALINFQRANGLDPVGVWNMQTQEKLFP